MRAAQRLAVASDLVRSEAIEATEFPDLVRRHRISGVPMSLFNGREQLLGAADEATFLDHALKAAALL